MLFVKSDRCNQPHMWLSSALPPDAKHRPVVELASRPNYATNGTTKENKKQVCIRDQRPHYSNLGSF